MLILLIRSAIIGSGRMRALALPYADGAGGSGGERCSAGAALTLRQRLPRQAGEGCRFARAALCPRLARDEVINQAGPRMILYYDPLRL